MTSIAHRVSGVGLTFGSILIVWWLLAAATGPDYFAFVDGLMTSWIGNLVMIGMTFALAYHFCNGIRHLFWDAGYGFDLDQAEMTGKVAVAGAIVLTGLVILIA